MEDYTTVLDVGTSTYEDRKSVFIGHAFPVSTEEQALARLAEVKKKYPDAKHHVFAYVLRENSITRFSDDREPQGTAGMPVLDSIRKRGITDAAVVVVRYFGGTLLGTGGLVRAYTEAAVGALDDGGIVTYTSFRRFQMKMNYPDYQKIVPKLSEFGIRTENTDFSDAVLLTASVPVKVFDRISEALRDLTGARVSVNSVEDFYSF